MGNGGAEHSKLIPPQVTCMGGLFTRVLHVKLHCKVVRFRDGRDEHGERMFPQWRCMVQ